MIESLYNIHSISAFFSPKVIPCVQQQQQFSPLKKQLVESMADVCPSEYLHICGSVRRRCGHGVNWLTLELRCTGR